MARLNILTKTIKRLYALSGNQCAFPGCNERLYLPDAINMSKICHIEAAKENGARYNVNSNDEYRRSFENLILLCPNHHELVDYDEKKYSVAVLKEMKKTHEDKMLLMKSESTLKYPHLPLYDVIKYIGVKIFDTESDKPQNAHNPQEKISYNNVIRYKFIIEKYAPYQAKLNSLYDEIEKQGSLKKVFLLENINNFYLEEKGVYKTLENIKMNADDIIDKVKNKLWDLINKSADNVDYDVIEVAVIIILVDAFIRCNILEEPPQNDS